jgi:hypothetical protein
MELVREQSVYLRLPFTTMPAGAAERLAVITGSTASWTANGADAIVTAPTLQGARPDMGKAVGMTVATSEFVTVVQNGQDMLTRDVARSVAVALDAKAFSTDAAVANEAPAGLLKDATSVSSTGATIDKVGVDLAAMIDALADAGLLSPSTCWTVSAKAKTFLALNRMLDVGGTLAGLPVYSNSTITGVNLIAADRIVAAEGSLVQLRASQSGTVDLGTAGTVNLFQQNLVALRGTVIAGWRRVDDPAKPVVVLGSPTWA